MRHEEKQRIRRRGGFLLDNNICVCIVKAQAERQEAHMWVWRWYLLHRDRCYIPATVSQELSAWLSGDGITEKERPHAEALLRELRARTLDVDGAMGMLAGSLSPLFPRSTEKSRSRSFADAQIAAVARTYGLTVVTNDRDFKRVPNLRRVDWLKLPLSAERYVSILKRQVIERFMLAAGMYGGLILVTTSTFRVISAALGVAVCGGLLATHVLIDAVYRRRYGESKE